MDRNDITTAKVAVLAGGWSDEREVSIASGREVRRALREAGFGSVSLIDIADRHFIPSMTEQQYDVAFVALHGKYGEDGCVQGLLETLDVPYTFSGVLASAMAMDKWVAKGVYERAGIPTAKGICATAKDATDREWLLSTLSSLGLPLFVKPASNGSSYGISKVEDADSLPEAIQKACDADDKGCSLIEEAIAGTEITVPVIGNGNPQPLPVIEIRTGADFYDNTVKYEPSELHHVIPAGLPYATTAKAQAIAARAHIALGCRGCSRSDFIVRESDGEPIILETNTIPGMTEASLLPDSARHAGIPFPELCKRFVAMALGLDSEFDDEANATDEGKWGNEEVVEIREVAFRA